jgi:fucose 4-O-acetylase-like acetyltransferase
MSVLEAQTHAPPAASAGAPDTRPAADRVAWVDIAKGIGIVLVVYGHVHGGLVDAGIQSRTGGAAALSSLIYTFHMPLFFLLAGLWLRRPASKPYGRFIADRAGSILYPYVLWSLIQFAANLCAARFTNAAPDPLGVVGILYRPYAQFWFLYVLFVNVAIVALVLRLRFGLVLALVIGAVLYGLHPLLEGVSWRPAAPIAKHLVYVVLGAAIGPVLTRHHPRRQHAAWIAGVCLVILVAVAWRAQSPRTAGSLVASVLGIIVVSAAAVSLATSSVGNVFQFLGRRSLEIYVAHVLGTAGVRIALLKFAGVTAPSVHLFAGMVVGLAFPLFIAGAVSYLRLPSLYVLRPAAPRTPTESAPTVSKAAPA